MDYRVLWEGLMTMMKDISEEGVQSIHPNLIIRFMTGAERAARDKEKAAESSAKVKEG